MNTGGRGKSKVEKVKIIAFCRLVRNSEVRGISTNQRELLFTIGPKIIFYITKEYICFLYTFKLTFKWSGNSKARSE